MYFYAFLGPIIFPLRPYNTSYLILAWTNIGR